MPEGPKYIKVKDGDWLLISSDQLLCFRFRVYNITEKDLGAKGIVPEQHWEIMMKPIPERTPNNVLTDEFRSGIGWTFLECGFLTRKAAREAYKDVI